MNHQQEEKRSEVEYIFQQFESPERSILDEEPRPQGEATMTMLVITQKPSEQTLHVDDVPTSWKEAQLVELIGATFSEMLTGHLTTAQDAAELWQFKLLHESDLDENAIQTGLIHLQGVIDAIKAARIQPTRWWPGKEGQMRDPRSKVEHPWGIASDKMKRQYHIRRVSDLGAEVIELETGLMTVQPRCKLKLFMKLTGKVA